MKIKIKLGKFKRKTKKRDSDSFFGVLFDICRDFNLATLIVPLIAVAVGMALLFKIEDIIFIEEGPNITSSVSGVASASSSLTLVFLALGFIVFFTWFMNSMLRDVY